MCNNMCLATHTQTHTHTQHTHAHTLNASVSNVPLIPNLNTHVPKQGQHSL